jgi:hypothetical protein
VLFRTGRLPYPLAEGASPGLPVAEPSWAVARNRSGASGVSDFLDPLRSYESHSGEMMRTTSVRLFWRRRSEMRQVANRYAVPSISRGLTEEGSVTRSGTSRPAASS